MLPNIAIIGAAGAGKTTVANLLTGRFMYNRLSFAEPLKVMLDTENDRARLQEFGTDVVRAYEPDAWVNLFLWNMKREEHLLKTTGPIPQPRFVVDDCRFPNEAAMLRDHGFVFIRVNADKLTRLDRLRRNGRLTDESQLTHSSEGQLDSFVADYVVENEEATPEDFLVGELQSILNQERT